MVLLVEEQYGILFDFQKWHPPFFFFFLKVPYYLTVFFNGNNSDLTKINRKKNACILGQVYKI